METHSPLSKALAWAVHLFTASGAIAAVAAMAAIGERDFRQAMAWLGIAFIIDGIDGTFARMCRVQEVLPNFDGKMVDCIIDFSTYAIIPTYFLYQSGLITGPLLWPSLSAMLLVSGIYYGKAGWVSNDLYFVGFPVLWNFVVLYLFFVFQLGSLGNALLVFFIAIMHLVPVKFIYPSRTKDFQKMNLAVSVLFLSAAAASVWFFPVINPFGYWGLLFSLVYFTAITAFVSLKKSGA